MVASAACPDEGDVSRGLVVRNCRSCSKVPYRAAASWNFAAPPGTSLVGMTARYMGKRYDNAYKVGIYSDSSRLVGCAAGGAAFCEFDTKKKAPKWIPLSGRKNVRIEARCAAPKGCSSARGGKYPYWRVRWHLYDVAVRVKDSSRPVVNAHSRELLNGAWGRGHRKVWFDASDNVGIRVTRALVDGREHAALVRRCDFTKRVPCNQVRGGSHPVNTAALVDGAHRLTIQEVDTAGNVGQVTRAFKVDNHAPVRPDEVTVAGGEGWRHANDFAITWRNPGGQASPIARAHYSLCRLGGSEDCSTGSRAGEGVSYLDSLSVPRTGRYRLRVWLRDEAGNASAAQASDAVDLRFDDGSPRAAFEPIDRRDPLRIAARVSDDASGVAGGTVELRQVGTRTWEELPTSLRSKRLVARVDDSELEPGTYELRARVVDHAGNESTSRRRVDGQPMLVRAPLRLKTRLLAGFRKASKRRSNRKRGRAAAKLRGVTRVSYGRGARLVGQLQAANGSPLRRAPVVLSSRVTSDHPYVPVRTSRTDGRGRFVFKIARGPSRELRVSYPGTNVLQPAQAHPRLEVRGLASLTLSPSRLRRGDLLTFLGRIRSAGTDIPETGKLFQIQFLDGRRWRPAVRLGRSDGRGRYRATYRFLRISEPTRVTFRILVPAESDWGYDTGTSRRRAVLVYP